MLTVACVLKAGGEFKPAHVDALCTRVKRHLNTPHRFVCLTDIEHLVSREIDVMRLENNWPGWWSKIELFAHNFGGPVLYMDLDTIPCGPLDGLGNGDGFTMLENFWRPDRVGSGLMAWDMDLTSIYRDFCRAPQAYMVEYTTPDKWGDQAFIWKHSPVQPRRFQKRFPGRIVSYKMHCRPGMDPKAPTSGDIKVPDGACIIAFHGQPRPWHTPLWKADL